MALQSGHKKNFSTLERASNDGALVLLECTDISTGNPVAVVCAASTDCNTGDILMVPLAKLFEGDPYKQVRPPE